LPYFSGTLVASVTACCLPQHHGMCLCCLFTADLPAAGLDLSKTGSNDIVVGREDGSLELYDMDEQGGLQQVGARQGPGGSQLVLLGTAAGQISCR
jgi:hypothetical protein